ncbi:MAG: hypothetical protein QOJ06_1662 [Pseudonocardiales bacterium]|jgi:hypothetical protein|nr:hypothetical protein [Pseudonocardiales bacterium]
MLMLNLLLGFVIFVPLPTRLVAVNAVESPWRVGTRRVVRSTNETPHYAGVLGIPPGRVSRRDGSITAALRRHGWVPTRREAPDRRGRSGQNVSADRVQRRGVERPGVASELGFGGVAVGGADRGGIAVTVSVITRTCPGPISPAASAAAVVGSNGARTSPVSARRGASWVAWVTRVSASVGERVSIPASSCLVLRNPAVSVSSMRAVVNAAARDIEPDG